MTKESRSTGWVMSRQGHPRRRFDIGAGELIELQDDEYLQFDTPVDQYTCPVCHEVMDVREPHRMHETETAAARNAEFDPNGGVDMDNVPYRVTDGAMNIISEGERTPNGEIVVNRANSERLFEFERGVGWVEQGAYASGPVRIRDSGLYDAITNSQADTSEWTRATDLPPEYGPDDMPDAKSEPPHQTILQDAQGVVYGEREHAYGHPRDNFARIAALWNGYAQAKILHIPDAVLIPMEAGDVAHMMILLKVARLMESPDHRDSWTDIAGYAGAGARAVGVDD